jgi:hypothetical protein
VNLISRLTAIGIPAQYRQEVVAAVTTGSLGSKAAAYGNHGPAIQQIINKVVGAAYGAFAHGLDLALLASGTLLVVSAAVALVTATDVRPAEGG